MSYSIFDSFGVSLPPHGDQRALSQAELQQLHIEHLAWEQNHRPTFIEALTALNYRRPVHVPQGWQDWFAVGDQLH